MNTCVPYVKKKANDQLMNIIIFFDIYHEYNDESFTPNNGYAVRSDACAE